MLFSSARNRNRPVNGPKPGRGQPEKKKTLGGGHTRRPSQGIWPPRRPATGLAPAWRRRTASRARRCAGHRGRRRRLRRSSGAVCVARDGRGRLQPRPHEGGGPAGPVARGGDRSGQQGRRSAQRRPRWSSRGQWEASRRGRSAATASLASRVGRTCGGALGGRPAPRPHAVGVCGCGRPRPAGPGGTRRQLARGGGIWGSRRGRPAGVRLPARGTASSAGAADQRGRRWTWRSSCDESLLEGARLDADQLVERYMLITCSTIFAGKSGPRSWSESVVEIVVHAAQSQIRKVK